MSFALEPTVQWFCNLYGISLHRPYQKRPSINWKKKLIHTFVKR